MFGIFYKIDTEEISKDYSIASMMSHIELAQSYPEFFISTAPSEKITFFKKFQKLFHIESEEQHINRMILKAQVEVFGIFGDKQISHTNNNIPVNLLLV